MNILSHNTIVVGGFIEKAESYLVTEDLFSPMLLCAFTPWTLSTGMVRGGAFASRYVCLISEP